MNRQRYYIFKLVFLLIITLSLTACDWFDDEDKDDPRIMGTMEKRGNLDTLITAIKTADLDDDLAGEGPFTIFAPTDTAFDALPPGTLDTLLDPANRDTLIDILGFHVYEGELAASDVIALDGTSITMLNGSNLRVDVVNPVILSLSGNREATVILTDIVASNGIIHVIDAVLDPADAKEEDIIQTAVNNGGFTTLVAALQAADLDDDLQGAGPFTVFAPTDAAFAALPSGTIDTLLEPANQELLIDILLYHVYDGSVLARDAVALDRLSVPMLNEELMSINVVDGDVILNLGTGGEASVIITDILCSNGVIHVIDTVLSPDDAPTDIVQTAVDNGSFTTLVAALQAAELDDDLQGAGPFTVFAPTDAAFAALPAGTIDTLLLPANQETLIDILLYHVYSGSVLAEDAISLDGKSVTMLNGELMSINVVGGNVVFNLGKGSEATVIISDIICSNGVIHVIDAVLSPDDAPVDIVQAAVDNGSFTTLVAALQAAELDDDLQGAGPFTVFAPTDAAFAALPAGTIDTLLLPANQATLIDILTYHVYSGFVLAEDAIALDGTSVAMLNEDTMSIDVVGGNVVLNSGGSSPATVITTDVVCSNGVIHVIDAVLSPDDAP